MNVYRYLRIVLAVAVLLPIEVIGAPSAGAVGGTMCKSFRGTIAVTPGLPEVGNAARVAATISFKDAELSGCHGPVSAGTASATLKFAKPSNCALLTREIATNIAVTARGKLTIAWNNKKKSTVAVSMSLGAVLNKPAVAKIKGRVTAGLFKGMQDSGTIFWSMGPTECFGGAPLTSLTFIEFSPFVTK